MRTTRNRTRKSRTPQKNHDIRVLHHTNVSPTEFRLTDHTLMEPSFSPNYNKPDAPGVAMNFDNTVSILQRVSAADSFDHAAREAFRLVKEAQDQYPDWPRVFYLEIDGHEGEQKGFDADFFEFQQEFWFATIAHFVTAFETPLLGGLINPNPQRNDIPDELSINLSDSEDDA